MPLTAAEKMRRRREKLKAEGKYEKYKQKVKEAVHKSRAKKQQIILNLPLSEQKYIQNKTRKDCKLRVVKHREKLAANKNKSLSTPDSPIAFKSKNSFGKATAKVNRALPKSPRKRKMVVKKLYENFIVAATDCDEKKEERRSTELNSETKDKVKKFYEREDLTRQAPGIKDVVAIRDANGNKLKVQARHLLLPIQEMHGIFLEENPDCKIGKSKFFELRPKHVLLSSKLPRNVCLCKHHENVKLAVEAFRKYHDFSTFSEFTNTFLCEPKTNDCWYSKCEKCCNQLEHTLNNITESENLNDNNWHVWKKHEGNLQKNTEEGTSRDLATHIKNLAPLFFKHVYTKREQSLCYRNQVEEVNFV